MIESDVQLLSVSDWTQDRGKVGIVNGDRDSFTICETCRHLLECNTMNPDWVAFGVQMNKPETESNAAPTGKPVAECPIFLKPL